MHLRRINGAMLPCRSAIDPNQLKNLKSCQLQFFMANSGELQPVLDSWKFGAPTLSSFTSDAYTWTPQNWVKDPKRGLLFRHGLPEAEYSKLREQAADASDPAPLSPQQWPPTLAPFNLLAMNRHIARAPPAPTPGSGQRQSANSWMFGASYANNFLHSFDRMMCDANPMLLEQTVEQLAVAPSGLSDTRLRVLGSIHAGSGGGALGTGYVKTLKCTTSVCPLERPFFLLISGFFGQERVKVTGLSDCAPAIGSCAMNASRHIPYTSSASCTAGGGTFTAGDSDTVTCGTLTIERDAKQPIDFTAAPPLDTNVLKYLEYPFPLLAPPSWTCSPRKYWANDNCDCDCGAFDPDCLEFGVEVTGCNSELKEQCSLHGKCGFHGFDSLSEALFMFNAAGGGNAWITDALRRRVDITSARGSCSGGPGCDAVTALDNATVCNTTIGNGSPCQFSASACNVSLAGNGVCDFASPANLLGECGYDGGDCLQPTLTNNFGFVFLSVECNKLYIAGESEMAGWVGSTADFAAAQSIGVCPVCPGDTLFGGRPTRDANGAYVCDNSPSGIVDTANGPLKGQSCVSKIGRACLTNEIGLEIFTRLEAPFPSPSRCSGARLVSDNCSAVAALSNATVCNSISGCTYTRGTPYPALLSTGHANQELVYIQDVSAVTGGRQTLLLSKSKEATEEYDDDTGTTWMQFKPLKKKHISRAELLSGILPDAMTIVVAWWPGPAGDGPNAFDSIGPYTIYIRGTSLTVASASTNKRDKVPHQVLTLAKPPPRQVGEAMKLLEDMPRESQTLLTVGMDYRYSWTALVDGTDPITAVVQPPNVAPMITKIARVWPSAWKCAAEQFNDGLICDCGCGMFDPDCGRVRNTAAPFYAGAPDGYWYINPALKRCRESDDDISASDAFKATGEMKCRKTIIEHGECKESTTNPDSGECGDSWIDAMDPDGAVGDKFAWVTWDNIDLNRNGYFDPATCLDSSGLEDDTCASAILTNVSRAACVSAIANDGNHCVFTEPDFRSGDCVPSGTRITLGSNHIQGTGSKRFNPYEKDHDHDGIVDVAITGDGLPVDGRPPIKTPPYHPGVSIRYRVRPKCKPTAAGNTSFCDQFLDMVQCAAQQNATGADLCHVVRDDPDGTNADIVYGTEYQDEPTQGHELTTDLKALTKYQKAHKQGADTVPLYARCGQPFCFGGPNCRAIDGSDDSSKSLDDNTTCIAQQRPNGAPCTYTKHYGCTSDGADQSGCDCLLLEESWRASGIAELQTKAWEGGTVALFMDGLELAKGYYLEDKVPRGTTVSTATMTRLRYFQEHAKELVRDVDSVEIPNTDPEDIPLSLFGLQNEYNSAVVSRFFKVQMVRKETPYRPEDRHLPTRSEPTKSPDVIDVDLSLFTIPDRMSFKSGALNYCPRIVVSNQTVPYMFADPMPGDMTSWKVRAGRELAVTSCTTTELTNITDGCVTSSQLKAAFPGQYRAKCSADMPPTRTFSFATEMYANNKWLYDGKSWSGYGRPDDGKYPAEYSLQV